MSFFNSAGCATQTGYGLVPLSWQEIQAWAVCNAVDTTPWELGVVRHMSEAYASESHQAVNPRRPAPYSPEIVLEDIDREAVEKKIVNIFSEFNKNRLNK